jgi:hypothetical protein
MLLLAAIAVANPASAGTVDRGSAAAVAVATATVRIERAVSIDRDQWTQAPAGTRREKIILDETGRPQLVRLVDLP